MNEYQERLSKEQRDLTDAVMARANELYREVKLRKMGHDPFFVAPEMYPQLKIQSDGMTCAVRALIEYVVRRVEGHEESYHGRSDD